MSNLALFIIPTFYDILTKIMMSVDRCQLSVGKDKKNHIPNQ